MKKILSVSVIIIMVVAVGGTSMVSAGSREATLTMTTPEWTLTANAQQAVAMAPDWVQDDLTENLSYLDDTHQDEAADLIINPGNPLYRDELCFLFAHTTPKILMHAKVDYSYFLENIQYIYDIAPQLSYVQLVEYGDPDAGGDYYTTVTYRFLPGGVEEWREAPREIYYWYVMHPKITEEVPRYTNPADQKKADPPVGVCWRPYLFYDSNETASYQETRVEYDPNPVTDDELDNWGPSALGTIINTEIVPTDMARDDNTGECVLGEIKHYTSNRCSTIIATTMRLEAAYAAGDSMLLENVLEYGNGNQSWGQNQPAVIFMDQADPAGTIVQQVMTQNGRNFTVHPSSEIGTLDLTDVKKVIIPSYQPLALYQAVAANMDYFNAWFDTSQKIFEIHLATTPENDPAGLVFPGGFTTSGQAKGTSNQISFYGYTRMADVVGNATYLWDEQMETLPTGRPFAPGQSAIDVLTNWISKVLKYRNQDGYRPTHPAAIARAHDGNCGELQDLVTAGARAMLIPAQGAHNLAWDHVWSEFWADGWHPNGVNWDGGEAFVDNPYFAFDTEYGGGKDLSAVTSRRGDDFSDAITERYSSICTLNVSVRDKNGEPVDSAYVRILVHSANNPDNPLTGTTAKYTDTDGTVSFNLGNNRDFWAEVSSVIGNYPASGDPEAIITDSQIDAVYNWDVVIDGTADVLHVTEAADPPDPMQLYRFHVQYDVTERMLHPNSFPNYYGLKKSGGDMDFFIADAHNFNLYSAGQPFEAFQVNPDTGSLDLTFEAPYPDTWYVVMDTTDVNTARQTVDYRIDLEKTDGSHWNTVDSADGHSMVPAHGNLICSATLEPVSVITDPVAGQEIPSGTYTIHGTASDSLGNTVTSVEISLDAGATWMPAAGTTTWTYDWTPAAPGAVTILSRATDSAGLVETPGDGVTVTVGSACEETGVTVWMPTTMFHPGDTCSCYATVCNMTGAAIDGYPLFVILDVYGNYYFAPSFSAFDNYLATWPVFETGESRVEVLPAFAWPADTGSVDGIVWYGALTTPDMTALYGNLGTFTFGWSE